MGEVLSFIPATHRVLQRLLKYFTVPLSVTYSLSSDRNDLDTLAAKEVRIKCLPEKPS